MNLHDNNFLKENNAKPMWHPMGHPGDLRENSPKIIVGAKGVELPISMVMKPSLGWVACGTSILVIPAIR